MVFPSLSSSREYHYLIFSVQFSVANPQCASLENTAYQTILKSLNFPFSNFDLLDIPDDKVRILIDLSMIPMNKETLAFMRNSYPSCTMCFITQNIGTYVDILDNEIILADEVKEVVKRDIEVKYQKSLLAKLNEPISVLSHSYKPSILNYILVNNFEITDIKGLVSEYDKYKAKTKTIIVELFYKHIRQVLVDKCSISYNLLIEILADRSHAISSEIKYQLLAQSLSALNAPQIYYCFEILRDNNYRKLLTGGRPKFIKNTLNIQILQILKSKGYITKYGDDLATGKLFAVGRRNIV